VLQLVPHVFLCRSLQHHYQYADGKMAYCCVLTVSIMCTDKQELLSVKFHLNEFSEIFVADSLVLHCCSHCNVALLTVSAW